jgi:hypothetical protein
LRNICSERKTSRCLVPHFRDARGISTGGWKDSDEVRDGDEVLPSAIDKRGEKIGASEERKECDGNPSIDQGGIW